MARATPVQLPYVILDSGDGDMNFPHSLLFSFIDTHGFFGAFSFVIATKRSFFSCSNTIPMFTTDTSDPME